MDIAPGAYAILPGAAAPPGAAPSGDGGFAQVLAQASAPEAAASAAPGAPALALASAQALAQAQTPAPATALPQAMAALPAAPLTAEVPATPAALPMAAPATVPMPTQGTPKPAPLPGPAPMAQPAEAGDPAILEATPAEPQAAAPPIIVFDTDAPATAQETDALAEAAATAPDTTPGTPTPPLVQVPVQASPRGAPGTTEADAMAAPGLRSAAAGPASEARVVVEPAAGQLQATLMRGAAAQATPPQHTAETDQPGTGAAAPQAAAHAPTPEAAIASPGLAALAPVDARRPDGEARRTSEATTPIAEQALLQAADSAAAPAATTQAEVPRAPPQAAPARQVTPAVVAVAISGGGRISVTLEPVELGRVEISVERSGDQPQVVILAERPETLALLQRDQRELDRALTQAGLPSEGRALSFGLTGGDAGAGQSQQRRDEAREGAPRGDGAARGVQSRDANAQSAVPPRRVAVSLLDLAI